ncbi:unnamed protein product [Linum trigynum]|uniref:Agglutinin domain-containing protein n=1 Tax=Linum trigynum TaxID=586398 RepID=A0AAV2E621_9ROSI
MIANRGSPSRALKSVAGGRRRALFLRRNWAAPRHQYNHQRERERERKKREKEIMSLSKIFSLYSKHEGKHVSQRDPNVYPALGVAADKVWSPVARFESEPSKSHPSMVHIKISYNNKYLCRRDSTSAENLIGASADKPCGSLG